MLDAGCWLLDAGYWLLDARYWMLDAGCSNLNPNRNRNLNLNRLSPQRSDYDYELGPLPLFFLLSALPVLNILQSNGFLGVIAKLDAYNPCIAGIGGKQAVIGMYCQVRRVHERGFVTSD